MSKGHSGLFSKTSGYISSYDGYFKDKDRANAYHLIDDLIDHIENVQFSESGRDGIKGAHNKEVFLNEIKRIGAKITGSTPHSQIDGVEKIGYKMPKKDRYGNFTGEYQSSTHYKTVYDPSKIDTDAYIRRGLEAANNSASLSFGRLDREWTGTDKQGVKWHGYCDSNGKISSFFPED